VTSSPLQGRRKRRKSLKGRDLEEFNKFKTPTFDDEINKGEEEKSWLLGLKNYFAFHDYSENLKA
jgi:hypothetical protein